MSYPIKYLLLQKSELQYEVNIRGEIPANTVQELRRQVTKLTQLYPANEILESSLDLADDLLGVNETLEKIKANLTFLEKDSSDNLTERTRSLLNHIYHRLQRIVKPATAEQLSALKSSTKMFDDYYAYFLQFTNNLENTDGVTTEHVAANRETISGLDNLKISVSCDRGFNSDLSKLKYDGKSCVRSFIQKVEEFKISKCIPDEKMFSAAFDIFTGDALHWYRAVRNDMNSWQDVIAQLKLDFDISDYDYRMLEEIRNRTQGDSENITIYLSIMHGMFSRLGKNMSEADRLEILLHNIRPCYSNIIATSPAIKSISDLRILCRNYEQVKARCDHFREPPAVNSRTLAPEFSYNAKNNKSNYFNPNANRYHNEGKFKKSFYSTTNTNNTNPNKISTIKSQNIEVVPDNDVCAFKATDKFCPRCKVDTHPLTECKAEREVFCFKCGMKNVRTPDCPKCSPKAEISEQKNF